MASKPVHTWWPIVPLSSRTKRARQTTEGFMYVMDSMLQSKMTGNGEQVSSSDALIVPCIAY